MTAAYSTLVRTQSHENRQDSRGYPPAGLSRPLHKQVWKEESVREGPGER